MITPSFAITATERVLPNMALDFTTAVLDSRVTFTRSGNTATVVNSSGLIAPINANLPRFDYDPTTLVCKGLLMEDARTNLMTYSEDFSNVSWTYNAPLVLSAANSTIAPDGQQTADTLSTTNAGSIYKFISGITGTSSYSASIFVKTSSTCTNATLALFITGVAPDTFTLTFNPSTGAYISNSGNSSYTVVNYKNGWYRFTVTGTGTNIANTFINFQIYNGQASANTLVLWGAQVELGAFPTSYIPTVASQVTRTADVAVMTGTNFSSWYNASQGAFVVESLSCAANGARFITVSQTTSGLTADNTIYIDATGQIRGVVWTGSAVAAAMNAGARPAKGTLTRSSLGYALDNYAASLNGATPATDVAGALPVVANTQLEIGQVANGFATTSINSHMRKIFYWPQRLINAEVQAFTK